MKLIKKFVVISVVLVIFTSISYVRPGGGGSSGGGGGRVSSSRSGGRVTRTKVNRKGQFAAFALLSSSIYVISNAGSIINRSKVNKSKHQCAKKLKELSNSNPDYKLDKIYQDVSDTFYIMSKAWTEMLY